MTLHVSIFYAHATGVPDDMIAQQMKEVQALVAAKWKKAAGEELVTVRATSGKKMWDERFEMPNDHRATWGERANKAWDNWAEMVVSLMDPTSGKPRFNLYICPNQHVGRATARILEVALSENRPVFHWARAEKKLVRVTWVLCRDPEDWKTGWRLSLREPKEGGVT